MYLLVLDINLHPVVRGMRGPRTDKNSCNYRNPFIPEHTVLGVCWTCKFRKCEFFFVNSYEG